MLVFVRDDWSSGALAQRGPYQQGQRHGAWSQWDSAAEPMPQQQFVDGALVDVGPMSEPVERPTSRWR